MGVAEHFAQRTGVVANRANRQAQAWYDYKLVRFGRWKSKEVSVCGFFEFRFDWGRRVLSAFDCVYRPNSDRLIVLTKLFACEAIPDGIVVEFHNAPGPGMYILTCPASARAGCRQR